MSPASHPLPMAGDYLVATFAEMMYAARFRKHVWGKMQLAERRRLEALRLQAVYGDAPDNRSNKNIASAPASGESGNREGNITRLDDQDSSKGALKAPSSPSLNSCKPAKSLTPTQPTPSPPRWFDIAGRARYSAWVALRGCMSPDVAAECFCAEFLALIKKYPHPALLPPVEAALSTAHGLAQRARSNNRRVPRLLESQAASSTSAAAPVFHVRALQGDPAALALLWICRAYRITCEFTVEPLSKAMGSCPIIASTAAAAGAAASSSPPSSSSPTTASPSAAAAAAAAVPANPYLSYTMADACYPFAAFLEYSTNASTPRATGWTTNATATVTTPESAFVLLADTFLSAYPHWMGVPSDLPSSSSPGVLPQRCGWIDELQHITRHLRTPILALLVHHATSSSSTSTSSNVLWKSPWRTQLLRAVAAHLHRYESWTIGRVISRRVGQAMSVLSPLLASTAVTDALQHAYAPDAKAVTAADVLVASCGYVLCTHPFCADVFPHLRVPVNHEADEGVRSEWPSDAGAAKTTAARSEGIHTYAPWSLPLYLSGIPAEYNEKINRLLRRESTGATRHEQQRQPTRLFINDNDSVITKGVGAASTQQQQRSAGYYEVSSASDVKEAAEAVGQLIISRLFSLRSDDLQHDDVAGSNSSVSGTPFLVLGHVFALTWALAQEQVPAFPFFMLDGNPDHFGGFSFLPEGAAETGKVTRTSNSTSDSGVALTEVRTQPRFQLSLAPAAVTSTADPTAAMLPTLVPGSTPTPSATNQDGGLSIESRLRSGMHAAGATLLKGVRRLSGASRDADAQARSNSGVHATHVLRSEGEGSTRSISGSAAPAVAPVEAARL
ncbi:hypothetical protein ABB37_06167 [Leptomonas pyrrhocoris]|uniref:Uncharacterized protein n=1 Tax=Leptomonas pyrrhocoris TaxID=157538 RepID=A0A0M9FYJ0_LEPPY|nr:hypothetical protein ABB37_06167 [Leptomonas pyrrhocoris]KPA78567.1 hypothetical protein ABB37_06167 [Leptomonas pyrrhocoris]|eukprot:XP_015657006.1 hypothetical protein ABB37_06167 [Leptomonas pyrrhocoris]